MRKRIAELLPSREGHFDYESGHHGSAWLELERLFLQPQKVRPLAEELAGKLRRFQADVVCAPLVEGAFVGLMVSTSPGIGVVVASGKGRR